MRGRHLLSLPGERRMVRRLLLRVRGKGEPGSSRMMRGMLDAARSGLAAPRAERQMRPRGPRTRSDVTGAGTARGLRPGLEYSAGVRAEASRATNATRTGGSGAQGAGASLPLELHRGQHSREDGWGLPLPHLSGDQRSSCQAGGRGPFITGGQFCQGGERTGYRGLPYPCVFPGL